jgi:hypothetical protein
MAWHRPPPLTSLVEDHSQFTPLRRPCASTATVTHHRSRSWSRSRPIDRVGRAQRSRSFGLGRSVARSRSPISIGGDPARCRSAVTRQAGPSSWPRLAVPLAVSRSPKQLVLAAWPSMPLAGRGRARPPRQRALLATGPTVARKPPTSPGRPWSSTFGQGRKARSSAEVGGRMHSSPPAEVTPSPVKVTEIVCRRSIGRRSSMGGTRIGCHAPTRMIGSGEGRWRVTAGEFHWANPASGGAFE